MSRFALRWDILFGRAFWVPPPRWEGTFFAQRRQFFENHRDTHGRRAGVCTACGFPTLMLQVEFDYCSACDWEDDGSDDPCADEISPGNGGITLNQARMNVLENGTMFCRADADWMHPCSYARVLGDEACAHRKTLFDMIDKVMILNSPEAISQQWGLIDLHMETGAKQKS